MSYVYILNRAGHDYSDAERFGELIYCTSGSLDKLDIQQMYREITAAFADSESGDWIVLTSLTSLCSVACAIFSLKHGRLNLLIHTQKGYVERQLFFNSTRTPNDLELPYHPLG
jgi:hypothetical protein